MKIAGITITHPEKIMFPGQKITKADIAEYYNKVADSMLPYLKDRPLTLQRYPEGIAQKGFFQKHAMEYYPDFIERIKVGTEKGEVEEIMCNNKKSLVYLANQNTIAFHVWLSRKNNLHRPDKVVIDLDPAGDASFTKIRSAAKVVHAFLQEKGIDATPMTSGKSGIHVFYNIRASKDFDQVREEMKKIAEQLVEKNPELFTLKMHKNERGNKIFFDYLRNGYGQTSVCPFSLRPNTTAGVATPLDWNELEKVKSGDQYHYQNFFRHSGAKST